MEEQNSEATEPVGVTRSSRRSAVLRLGVAAGAAFLPATALAKKKKSKKKKKKNKKKAEAEAPPESGSEAAGGSSAPKVKDYIVGSVWEFVADVDKEPGPISGATVTIRPEVPQYGASGVPAPDLVGLAFTDNEGRFEILNLSSPSQKKDFGVLPRWSYKVEVQAPGYYVFGAEIDYWEGQDNWDFELEAKPTDVVDESGGIKRDRKSRGGGAVRKGK